MWCDATGKTTTTTKAEKARHNRRNIYIYIRHELGGEKREKDTQRVICIDGGVRVEKDRTDFFSFKRSL